MIGRSDQRTKDGADRYAGMSMTKLDNSFLNGLNHLQFTSSSPTGGTRGFAADARNENKENGGTLISTGKHQSLIQ